MKTRNHYKYTKVYDRMIEAMQLQSFSPRTQQSYVRAVRKLAEFYDKSPARITEAELCQYFLHRKNVDQWSSTACRIALCGIKFFYQKTLNRKWTKAKLIKPKKDKTLPIILSATEARAVLKAIRNTQERFNHYAIAATMYSCGLRLGEAIPLRVTDVQSKRGFLHVRGKGAKDRYVPLPPRTLQILRMNWMRHRNPVWLFPSPGRGGKKEAIATVESMLSGNAFGEAGHRVVVEECLEGEEASFIVMVDGQHILPLATSQDHKARDNGDTGPNTGGMGAYSPAPVVTPTHRRRRSPRSRPVRRGTRIWCSSSTPMRRGPRSSARWMAGRSLGARRRSRSRARPRGSARSRCGPPMRLGTPTRPPRRPLWWWTGPGRR